MGASGTRKLPAAEGGAIGFEAFCARWRASLVVLAGSGSGSECELDQERIAIGRGPDVELCLDDDSMSRSHAAVEFAGGGFRVRDLGSTNGTFLNGGGVVLGDLAHGDRIQLGEHVLQYLLEERPREPRTYTLPEL